MIFDETKIINPLHTEKAVIGNTYYVSYSITELKRVVETEEKNSLDTLENILEKTDEPYIMKGSYSHWEYLYPAEKKEEYMNTIQLAEWLARGNGFVRDGDEVATTIQFVEHHSDFTTRNLKIKSFGADDWEEPLLAIYERDCINRGNNNL